MLHTQTHRDRMDQLIFTEQNRIRIQAVEKSFASSGQPLYEPGRVLIGEGHLRKQRRRGGFHSKAFFLFNDLLVYGSVVLSGRWYKKQKTIRLTELQLEDVEDQVSVKNRWLIRTPSKSFYVVASSPEEKRAWIRHTQDCLNALRPDSERAAGVEMAVTWIPDQASAVCMRCFDNFTFKLRRHHCRKCGFIVCGACSKQRAVIHHMDPRRPRRVCTLCHSSLSTDTRGTAPLQDHKREGEGQGAGSWAVYVYLKPEHITPYTHTQDDGDELQQQTQQQR